MLQLYIPTVYSYLMLEVKNLLFLQKVSLSIFGRENISRRKLSSPRFWWRLLIKRGSAVFKFFFFGGGGRLSKKWLGQYFRVGLMPWRTLCLYKVSKYWQWYFNNLLLDNLLENDKIWKFRKNKHWRVRLDSLFYEINFCKLANN